MKKWISGMLVFLIFCTLLTGNAAALSTNANDVELEFPYAVFAKSKISLNGSSRITGDVGINTADITMGNGKQCIIDGKLFIGPGQSVNYNSSKITGGVFNLASEQSFALPEFSQLPSDIPQMGELTIKSTYTIKQDAWYEKLSIVSDGTLTIDVGSGDRIIRIGTLNFSQGHIKINGTGRLFLFVENAFSIKGSSTLNRQGDSGRIHVYVEGAGTVELSGNARVAGSIYAPNANIDIQGSAQLEGNIVAGGNSITLSGNTPVIGAVYAPNAKVEISGSSKVVGAMVCNEIDIIGNSEVQFEQVNCTIPEVLLGPKVTDKDALSYSFEDDKVILRWKDMDADYYLLWFQDEKIDNIFRHMPINIEDEGKYLDENFNNLNIVQKALVLTRLQIKLETIKRNLEEELDNPATPYTRKQKVREFLRRLNIFLDYLVSLIQGKDPAAQHYLQKKDGYYAYEVSNLEDKIYYAALKAYKDRKLFDRSESELMTVTIDLRLPQSIQVIPNAQINADNTYKVTVQYIPSESLPEVTYELYKRMEGSDWTKVVPTGTTEDSFVYTEENHQKIYYKVVARNKINHTVEAGADNSVFLDLRKAPSPGITARYDKQGQQVNLTIDVTDAEGITKKMEIYKNGVLVETIENGLSQTWNDSSVVTGETYTYQVFALNQYGVKTASNTETITVEKDMMEKPSILEVNVFEKDVQDGEKKYDVQVKYTVDSNAKYYHLFIEGKADPVGEKEVVQGLTKDSISFETSSTSFEVYVRPIDKNGEYGEKSESVEFDKNILFEAVKPNKNITSSEVYIVGDDVTFQLTVNSNKDMKNVKLDMTLNDNASAVFYENNIRIIDNEEIDSSAVHMENSGNVLAGTYRLYDEEYNEDDVQTILKANKTYQFVFKVKTNTDLEIGRIENVRNLFKLTYEEELEGGTACSVSYNKNMDIKVYTIVPQLR
jgi:cytoskeletal protein CcmA (bactofilin family)